MTKVMLVCPDCGRGTVRDGRGRCKCGSYLIHHFAGSNIFLPAGRVWAIAGDGTAQLLSDGKTERAKRGGELTETFTRP